MKEKPEIYYDEWMTKHYYLLSKGKDYLHREDGPAVETITGNKVWFINGKRHREDGPAVIKADGTKEWWLNGKRHREDGPAITLQSEKVQFWYKNGKKHRLDGPAIMLDNGYEEWWINNKEISKQEVTKIKKWIDDNNIDLTNEDDQFKFLMKWG